MYVPFSEISFSSCLSIDFVEVLHTKHLGRLTPNDYSHCNPKLTADMYIPLPIKSSGLICARSQSLREQ